MGCRCSAQTQCFLLSIFNPRLLDFHGRHGNHLTLPVTAFMTHMKNPLPWAQLAPVGEEVTTRAPGGTMSTSHTPVHRKACWVEATRPCVPWPFPGLERFYSIVRNNGVRCSHQPHPRVPGLQHRKRFLIFKLISLSPQSEG